MGGRRRLGGCGLFRLSVPFRGICLRSAFLRFGLWLPPNLWSWWPPLLSISPADHSPPCACASWTLALSHVMG